MIVEEAQPAHQQQREAERVDPMGHAHDGAVSVHDLTFARGGRCLDDRDGRALLGDGHVLDPNAASGAGGF
jgi:hypothetical protein